MWIKTFSKLIEVTALEDYVLKAGSEIVIDGQNFFYTLYEQSNLPYIFGCESDKYADFVKKRLMMFKMANIKCYFLLKGGHSTKEKMLSRYFSKFRSGKLPEDNATDYLMKPLPIFMKEVYKQVLDELGLDYTICQYESIEECIAMAQKYQCPVLGFGIKMCFTNVKYVPHNSLEFDEKCNTINCKIYHYDKFLTKSGLNEEKFAIFAVLTDLDIFPEHNFMNLFKHLRTPLGFYKRNLCIIRWLSRLRRNSALDIIFKFNPRDKPRFLEEECKMRQLIGRQPVPGVPTTYLENGLVVEENDPMWLEKGVAAKYIDVQYVNVYRHGVITGSWVVDDGDADSAMLLSCDLIKYALDLMTDFRNDGLTLTDWNGNTLLTNSVEKPTYEAVNCVFENGWDRIRSLKLFEHYFIETLQGFDFSKLTALPEDCRLLMVALVYFTRQKAADTTNEVYSVLLSYIILSMLGEHSMKDVKRDITLKPILDSTTDRTTVLEADKATAAAALRKYNANAGFELVSPKLNRKLLHPLVELQYLINQVNALNTLCGSPFERTIYSKTYNGTFVYKILWDITETFGGNGDDFLKHTLGPAPTVYAFINGLLDVYKGILFA